MKKNHMLYALSLMTIGLLCSACKKEHEVTTPPPIEQKIDSLSIEQELIIDKQLYDNASTQLGYEAIIHSLGFSEFYANIDTNYESDVKYEYDSLTYNDQSFAITISAITADASEKWILYGTKADKILNLSTCDPANYEYVEMQEIEDLDEVCQRQIFDFYNVKNNKPTDYTHCAAYYFPETGNVYNLVKSYENAMEFTVIYPEVLLVSQEARERLSTVNAQIEWVNGIPVETAEFSINRGTTSETFRYRVGMTLSAWATSELNTSSWFVGFDDAVFSADYEYYVPYANIDIRRMTYNGIINAEINTEYDKAELADLFNYFILPTAQAHLVNWDSPLLTTGVRVMGEYTGSGDFGHFNLGTRFSINDTIQVFVNNINPAALKDIKLCLVPEPPQINVLFEHGLEAHNKYSSDFAESLIIPEGTECYDFVEYTEAPIDNVAVATYIPQEDENFTFDGSKALVITYKGRIIYWIHMPLFATEIVQEELDEPELSMTQEELEQYLKDMEEQGFILEEIDSPIAPHENHNH